jgi:hypothetical protein
LSGGPPRDVMSPAIRRVAAEVRSLDPSDFWALRSQAIAAAQAASNQQWTDYNLHDPGVTIIEAMSYALTELAYRADFDVADHLTDEEGKINGLRHGLFEADRIFPARALTPLDICKTLLDENPAVDDVWLSSVPRVGLLQLRFENESDDSPDTETIGDEVIVKGLRRKYDAQRSLGEDLDDNIFRVGTVDCRLSLEAVLTGVRDPSDIAAEIFIVCARLLAQAPKVSDRRTLKANGMSLEVVYLGPLTKSGVIEIQEDRESEQSISVSDLRGCISAVPGIAEVRNVGIWFDDVSSKVLRWNGQVLSWNASMAVPKLIMPDSDGSANKAMEHIFLHRRTSLPKTSLLKDNETDVAVETRAVCQRIRDMRAGQRKIARAEDFAGNSSEALPKGRFRLAPHPASIGALLPRVYGLDDGKPSGGINPARADQPDPFATYLSLIDQLLVSSGAQISHYRDLFTSEVRNDNRHKPSYWPQLLDDGVIAGIEQLYSRSDSEGGLNRATGIDGIADQIFGSFDDSMRRRQKILDFLLALYGETVNQDVLGKLLPYLDSVELAAALLDNKAEWLRNIVTLTRDRGAGPDLAKPIWTEAATSGFHKRIALLLGFSKSTDRRLVREVHIAGQTMPQIDASNMRKLAWPPRQHRATALPEIDSRQPLPSPQLFGYGVDRANYRWDEENKRLALIISDKHDAIDLGSFADEAAASSAAATRRQWLLAETEAAEGLHVVEHILLRQRFCSELSERDVEHLAWRVTLVLPDWTARTSSTDFRFFADEVARINCPAHLIINCLWLNQEAMLKFETEFQTWRTALKRLFESPDDEKKKREVNAAAIPIRKLVTAPLGDSKSDKR